MFGSSVAMYMMKTSLKIELYPASEKVNSLIDFSFTLIVKEGLYSNFKL